jgi:hypothetical protein
LIGFVAVCLAIYLTGQAIARRLYASDGAERVVASAIIGIASWLAVLWLLAITHQLNRRNLIAAVIPFAVVALWEIGALWQVRRLRLPRITRWTAAVALPILLWVVFILWRSAVVPPQNHDAMTYHLPKAILMLQAEGFERFASYDSRLVAFPCNYELLLTSAFVLHGSDQLSEWIGAAFYLLFLGCTAMVAERWWGRGPHVAATVLAAAGMPLLLLHSGADKNDVMVGALACAAVFWTARWCTERGAATLVLATLSGVLTVGTKLTAVGIGPALAPFVVAAIVRRPPRVRHVAAAAAFAAVAFLLLGGWVFLSNATAPSTPGTGNDVTGGVFEFAWENLWVLPRSLVTASLGLGAVVPWPKHNLINSHFGPLFGLSALFLPVALWRYRGEGDTALRRERLVATAASALSVAIVLPFVPHISFGSTARYAVILVPFVLGWSVPRLLRDVTPRIARAALASLLVLFTLEAIDIGMHDTFVSPEYLRWAAAHPGARRPSPAVPRAATIADELAGPNDRIAFHSGLDGWLYPLYGRGFTRRVRHLSTAAGIEDVPRDAQWLVIDRAPSPWHPTSEEDVRLLNAALASGDFHPVYYDRLRNQAVLRREVRR